MLTCGSESEYHQILLDVRRTGAVGFAELFAHKRTQSLLTRVAMLWSSTRRKLGYFQVYLS